MRAAGVVEAYPVADGTACVLQGLKAMTMRALLLERTDDPLDHAVLLWALHAMASWSGTRQRGCLTCPFRQLDLLALLARAKRVQSGEFRYWSHPEIKKAPPQ